MMTSIGMMTTLGAIGAAGLMALALRTQPAHSTSEAGAPAMDATPVLVELFTSEGCSSCPPADRLLRELTTEQPVPGVQILGLSEHVDYWDRLGWKDPFSNTLFSERQSAYAAASGSAQVYTPQMIVDGQDAFVGSDRAAAVAAIRRAASTAKAPLQATWDDGGRTGIAVVLAPSALTAKADVYAAVFENGLTSSVKAGENAGHSLAHDGVTRRLSRVGTTGATGAVSLAVPIAFDRTWNASQVHVAIFVSTTRTHRIVAAALVR